jgi:hypothetical protein
MKGWIVRPACESADQPGCRTEKAALSRLSGWQLSKAGPQIVWS